MTELEWQICSRPTEMLDHLRGRCSDRKLRLFACACCRRIWHRLTDARSRLGVEVAERYADGEASDKELLVAFRDAWNSFGSTCSYGSSTGYQPARTACTAAFPKASLILHEYQIPFRTMPGEWQGQADLLRCLFGNPFRPIQFDRAWCSRDAVGIAQAIYDNRDFLRLPMLAEAIHDAGCADEAVIAHCWDGGEHARGCWVVDAVLCKE